jgi:hypothetical protein
MAKTLLLGGSISIKKIVDNPLYEDFLTLLKLSVEPETKIVIGDAWGADTILQRLLLELGVKSVVIYHVGDKPRNNVGNWSCMKIEGNYTKRDIEMCLVADSGIFLWDGFSKGTLRNIEQLKKKLGSEDLVTIWRV